MLAFLKQTIANFHHTGAVSPSSPWLARAIAEPLAARGGEPVEFLEAGPGTGAITAGILPHLRPGDRLTLCEINADFVTHLERRFRDDPAFAPHAKQVTIHHGPVEDTGLEARFTHIVCGIPFNNFEPALVERIFASFRKVLLEGGTVNFFEYAAVRELKRPFVSGQERQRIDGVACVIGNLVREHQVSAKLVPMNFPPAWARCLKF
jgi:phospholipid N-methyltransferase